MVSYEKVFIYVSALHNTLFVGSTHTKKRSNNNTEKNTNHQSMGQAISPKGQ